MPRQQRQKSQSGYYHIMIRGNERRNIFLDDKDRLQFVDTLYEKKQVHRFYLHAFCLMDNHVHLVISEGDEDIATTMKRITVSYVYYFNKKYERVGHLFQDRFKSEAIEGNSYVISLVRYIHQNPVKATMVKTADEYKWSSCNSYSNTDNLFAKILDMDIVLELYSSDREKAQKLFASDLDVQSPESFLDLQDEEKMIAEEAAKALFDTILLEHQIDRNNYTKAQLTTAIKEFKDATNLSIRKISSITGLNKDKINQLLKS
jgi:REP element-mobilizing transposase RayT